MKRLIYAWPLMVLGLLGLETPVTSPDSNYGSRVKAGQAVEVAENVSDFNLLLPAAGEHELQNRISDTEEAVPEDQAVEFDRLLVCH
jgi:hypothetical protein